MKAKLVIAFLVFSFNGFAQDSLFTDKVKMKIAHIPTHGYFTYDTISYDKDSLDNSFVMKDTSDGILSTYEAMKLKLDSTTLITLSFVDKDSSITNNWDKFKEKYQDNNYLILVTNTDDESKGDFLAFFYQQCLTGIDIKTSYELTVFEYQGKYQNLKHYLNTIK